MRRNGGFAAARFVQASYSFRLRSTHQFFVQGNIEDMNHMLRGGGQALVAARDSDNRG